MWHNATRDISDAQPPRANLKKNPTIVTYTKKSDYSTVYSTPVLNSVCC